MRLLRPVILAGIVTAATACSRAPTQQTSTPTPAVAGTASSPSPTHADVADAVAPYSYERQAALPHSPFLARFEKGDEELFFIGVPHGCDAKTFALIEEVLAQGRVRLVIQEGRPRSAGLNASSVSRSFDAWAKDGFCKGGGESGYLAWRASQHGIPYVGGEPDERDVAQAVLARGFTAEDLLAYLFIRSVPQMKRQGTIASSSDVEPAFQRMVRRSVEEGVLDPARAAWSFDAFRAWYQANQGKAFDVATVDNEEAAPLANGPFFSQKVGAVVSDFRNRFMVRSVEKDLAAEKRVLIVLGASHFATQRAAYELLLGAPRELTSRAGP